MNAPTANIKLGISWLTRAMKSFARSVVEYITSHTLVFVLPTDRNRLNYLLNGDKYRDCLHDIIWGDIRNEWKHGDHSKDYWEALDWCREKIFEYIADYDLEV